METELEEQTVAVVDLGPFKPASIAIRSVVVARE